MRFRDESTKDVVTGLENRRGFEVYVDALIEGGKNLNSGAMFMLQIADFQGFNEWYVYENVDVILKDISSALKSVWQNKDSLRARVNGATFALVAINISREEAMHLGHALTEAVGAVVDALQGEASVSFGCGAVCFSGQAITLQALLAQCDVAMLQSLSSGDRQCVLQSLAEDDQSKGSQHWKHLIIDAIAAQRITLFSQPVMDIRKRDQLQTEIVGRLMRENGELGPAEQFLPR